MRLAMEFFLPGSQNALWILANVFIISTKKLFKQKPVENIPSFCHLLIRSHKSRDFFNSSIGFWNRSLGSISPVSKTPSKKSSLLFYVSTWFQMFSMNYKSFILLYSSCHLLRQYPSGYLTKFSFLDIFASTSLCRIYFLVLFIALSLKCGTSNSLLIKV